MKTADIFKKNRLFSICVAFTIIEGLLTGCSTISIYFVLTMLQNHITSFENIIKITGLVAAIFLIRFVIYGIGYTQGQIGGTAVSKRIRLYLGDKFKKIPLFRFTQGQVGQYVNTITTDVNSYEQILTHKVGDLSKNITLSVILIAFVSALYLPAGMILLASNLLLIPGLRLSFFAVKKYGEEKNMIAAESVSSIVEYISGIQTFRSYGVGGTKNKTTTDAMKAFSNISYLYEAKVIPIGFGLNILNWMTIPIVMKAASIPWIAGALNNVDYLLLCMLPLLMAKLTVSIFIDLTSYKNLMISKNNIMKVINEKEEQGDETALSLPSHEIVFDHVCFSYVKGEQVLTDVSFIAKDQELTAIVGDSGSGKSTILNLIAKYYEADMGKILIGSKATENIAAERVLENISMVDQDIFLFDDTIRENIRYARPSATDAEIETACKLANCHDFIMKMEHGYDTSTGENGILLSGGERQRLSIARAFLKDSPILLLDEATAALDIENELAVKLAISNLMKQRKTVIMIAHTLSIIKNADQILVVDNGNIAESGTHTQLLKQNGKYANMWYAEEKLYA